MAKHAYLQVALDSDDVRRTTGSEDVHGLDERTVSRTKTAPAASVDTTAFRRGLVGIARIHVTVVKLRKLVKQTSPAAEKNARDSRYTVVSTLTTARKERNARYRHCLRVRFFTFLARDSMLSALYAIARPSVRHTSDQSKTVEVRITQFSPYNSLIPLVFAGCFIQKLRRDPAERGRLTMVGCGLAGNKLCRSSNAFARWLPMLDILSQLLQTYSPGGGPVAL